MAACRSCGRELWEDEISLHKKLINRGATDFWCLTCLASHFNVSEDTLRAKAEQFRAMGCTLFGDEIRLPDPPAK